MKRSILLIILACLLVIPLVGACTKTDEQDSSGVASGEIPEELGLEKKDWGGKEIKFVTLSENSTKYTYFKSEIAPDSTTGSNVNDASLKRAQKIEEQFNIKIAVDYLQSDIDTLKNSIMAGDCEYHVVVNSLKNMADFAINGLFWDINEIGLDTSKPWWDQAGVRDLSVSNHLYFITGDIIVSDIEATWVCFFNKDMIEDNGLGKSPYQYVKDGDWTVDNMYEMCKQVSVINQGLPSIGLDEGTFGLITQTYDGISMMMAYGQKMIAKDENDDLLLNIDNDPTKTKFMKMFEIITDASTSLIAEKATPGSDWTLKYENANKVFQAGRALFQPSRLGYVQALSEVELDFSYGIVPLPKYDEIQDSYYSSVTVYWALFLGIPFSVQPEDFGFISYALQAMGYYGKEYIRPAYYDTTIKLQKLTDADSEAMLDIIIDNRIYDLASVYDFGSALYLYTDLIGVGNSNIASSIESRSPEIQAKMEEVMNSFNKSST